MEKVAKQDVDIVRLAEQLGLDKDKMLLIVFEQELAKVANG
jgi:hypothetical protein